MRLTRRVIIGSLFSSSLVLPAGIKAQVGIEYHKGYYIGAVHTACEMYSEGIISRSMVREFMKYLKKGDDNTPQRATNEAFALLANDQSIKNCPVPR